MLNINDDNPIRLQTSHFRIECEDNCFTITRLDDSKHVTNFSELETETLITRLEVVLENHKRNDEEGLHKMLDQILSSYFE